MAGEIFAPLRKLIFVLRSSEPAPRMRQSSQDKAPVRVLFFPKFPKELSYMPKINALSKVFEKILTKLLTKRKNYNRKPILTERA